jgi:NDP-sugar pyrophosphorylase family protein
MGKKFNIFILAAGLGERLRPITDQMPKPLLPVLGKPALQYVIDNVSSLPFSKIGINLHHKKEAIEEWVSKSPLNEMRIYWVRGLFLFTIQTYCLI